MPGFADLHQSISSIFTIDALSPRRAPRTVSTPLLLPVRNPAKRGQAEIAAGTVFIARADLIKELFDHALAEGTAVAAF